MNIEDDEGNAEYQEAAGGIDGIEERGVFEDRLKSASAEGDGALVREHGNGGKQYGDFTLKFEFKLGERGNSGCGLRFPPQGDPAFDGLELQMVDPRYYPPDMTVPKNELTGSLYRAVGGRPDLLKPLEWNSYEVTCQGSKVKVALNGKEVLNVDLSEHDKTIQRHNGQDAPPLKDRPRKGHIGFQELSRAGGHVEIRNAVIKEL